MHPELRTQWDALEVQRTAFVARVTAFPTELQSVRPTPKDFSPVEVLMHFALAEGVDLAMMQKTPPASLSQKRAKPNFIFRFAVKGLAEGKRMPTAPTMTPEGQFTLQEATEKWAEVRQQMAAILEPLPSPNAPAIRHSIFGILSAADLIALLDAHTRYHVLRFAVATK